MFKKIKKCFLKALYHYHYHMTDYYGINSEKAKKHIYQEFKLVNMIAEM